MTTPRPDSRLGTDLGPYRIERVLGRGGMGVVYLAEQRELGRKVALKLLPDELAHDADFRARFDRESHLAASIDHPNIIPLYEAGEIDGTAFLAMRFVDGVDLASRLGDGPMDPTEAVAILGQVAGALDAAHARGLVHRDVKPGNVLLDRTAQGEHAYLTDFGLTKETGTESGLTRVGSFMGTPAYMAPEQIEGQDVDGRADQYSLACMAFELLVGRVPFQRDQEFAVAMAHVRDQAPAPTSLKPDLPGPVDVVIGQALAKDREARYATCSAFIDDMRAALGGRAVSARPISLRTWRRTPVRIAAAAIALGLVAIGGLAFASGLGRPGSDGASPSGSLAALISPSPAGSTSSPTPDPAVFPNPDEQAVIALLPPDLQASCARSDGRADTTQAGFVGRAATVYAGDPPKPVFQDIHPPAPKVGLACVPASGADRVVVQTFRPEGGTSDPASIAETALAYLAARYEITQDACSATTPATTTWSKGGSSVSNGYVVCIPEAGFEGGGAWIYWSFDRGKVLAFASRADGDFDALHRWWKNVTLFIE
ncbi:MAG TPA: serine/threonine-protein kinase [Candidatus Limnocylindrales bacterium]